MKSISIVTMYGITPCHAGSGSSLGVIDLPIQRERASNWPVIQASGVKGAIRANFEKYKNNISDKSQVKDFDKITDSIFGCSTSNESGSGFAGSLSVSDAKILAYPMRSNISPFVWITCPSVLKRLVRDLEFAGKNISLEIPDLKDVEAKCINGNCANEILLEDYQVNVSGNFDCKELSEYLTSAERLILVSDDVFNYGVTDCTQIMAQIRIDSKTGTTEDGSLRYQEELPSDTLMYTVICWGDSKNSTEAQLKAETIKNFVTLQVIKNHIQIAGDESCGRGIFKLEWK